MFDSIKDKYPKEKWQENLERINKSIPIVPKGLEALHDIEMFDYLVDTIFAHWYAIENRWKIMDSVMEALGASYGDMYEDINTTHNYINYKDFIIRKGAVAAYKGEKIIIPFNMEDGILVCEGKSNPEWNFSAPHGAGRLFSRSEAKEKLNLEEATISMQEKGIYSSVIPLDEAKGAYKPAEVIEKAIEPTAKVFYKVKPVINLKAGDPEE